MLRSRPALAALAVALVLGGALAGCARGQRPCAVARCEHLPFTRPLVSIEFDDGYVDALRNGVPVVRSFGWPVQLNVITGTPGPGMIEDRRAYLSDDDIRAWAQQGAVASHSVTHPAMTHLSDARATAELVDSKARLESLIGRPVTTFVSPGCDHDERTATLARRVYRAVRNCDPHPAVNDDEHFDRWNLRAYPVKRDIPPEWILDQLTQTKASNGWSIFFWHHVDDRPTGDAYTVTVAQLRRDLQLIKDSGITVVSSDQALLEELGGAL